MLPPRVRDHSRLFLSHAATSRHFEATFLHVYNLISRVKVQFKSDKTAGVWFVLRVLGGGRSRLRGCQIASIRSCPVLQSWEYV
jgi:hypothetical protein